MQNLKIKTARKDLIQSKVEQIDDHKSPEGPMSPLTPMTPASPQIQKDCPVCLEFMTKPYKLPSNVCEHRMCFDCMKDMFEQGSHKVFKLDENLNTVCVKCPVCRSKSFMDLKENWERELEPDTQLENMLKQFYGYEYRANQDEEYKQEMNMFQEQQYQECIQRMQENCPLVFEIGIRDLSSKNDQQNSWQSFVRLKNEQYQNIIDKILYRVDFCINQTNLIGNKDPIVLMTNDYLFRTLKRKSIKAKQAPEIQMQPMGQSKSHNYLSRKPEFLPVKLYFNDIEGICCQQREVIHDDLLSGKNNVIEFRVIASKAALDELLEEDD